MFLALYALQCVRFCSNDCFTANMVIYLRKVLYATDELAFIDLKVGGSIPPPRYQPSGFISKTYN